MRETEVKDSDQRSDTGRAAVIQSQALVGAYHTEHTEGTAAPPRQVS